MLRLTPARRALLADKFPDLANLFAGGFVVGQSVGGSGGSVLVLVLGLVLWAVFMGFALLIAEDER